MRVPINLASQPFVNYRSFLLIAGLLAVITVGVTVLLGGASLRAWQERISTQAQVKQLKERHRQLTVEQQQLEATLLDPATQQRLERVRFVNQMIGQKVLSWTRLFFDLQERLPASARILSLEPSLREDGRVQVELRVGGESVEAVIGFLESLEKSEKFGDVSLQSQNVGSADELDAWVAQMSAIYAQE